MDCSWIEDRLVALQDDELSRSEHEVVTRHLQSCAACAELEQLLAGATPEPFLQVPAEVQARLALAVDAAIDSALAEQATPAAPPSVVERSRRWLRRDRDLSNGAMLAYAAALAICLGWGLSNWMAIQDAAQPPTSIARNEGSSTVSSEHYSPASYAVEKDAEPGEDEWR